MTNQENKLYQLTCLFSPSVDMEKINERIQKIKQRILSNEGIIPEEKNYSSEPIKKGLAYSIDKKQEAFYWNLNFLFAPKQINKLKEKISQGKNIIRCIITNKKEQKAKPIKESIDFKMIDTIEPLSDKESKKAPTQDHTLLKEKVKIEELDKKLEEILNQ